jgi:hypothetical protein
MKMGRHCSPIWSNTATKEDDVGEIQTYPELVDTIWTIVQGTPEERERVDFLFSEEQVARRLDIPWSWDSDPCVFGVAQALNDLVDMGYCQGRGSFNGHRWMYVSPFADSPDAPPSAAFIAPPLPKLPPLRRRALLLIHEHAVRHEVGVTFYILGRMLHQEAIAALFSTTTESDMHTARGEMIQAMSSLETGGFVAGSISSGALTLRVTLKGACWLLVAQPLLQLEERASRLAAYPEALEATELLINAHSESERNAAGVLYVAFEKLENAAGGERGLIGLLGQPRAYVSDLKQALQPHRHATTPAQARLTHQACLTRMGDIIDRYMTSREQDGH